MRRFLRLAAAASAPLALLALLTSHAARGDEATLGPKSLSYGVGLRAGGGYATNSPSQGFGVPTLDVRPYIGGQVAPWLKFSGNLDLNNGDGGKIHVLDAVVQLEPTDLFNVWMGRFLPPSDRANLSGPYYQNAWNYPGTVNGYPSIYAGRADGAAVWGQVGKGQFKYQAGIFTVDPVAPIDQAIYAARLVFNALDPEPGYYNSSTYYGKKDVLAFGGTVQYKKTSDATIGERTLVGVSADVLFEKRLEPGVLTLEGAWYNFNGGTDAPLHPGTGRQGWSFFTLASWLFPSKVGPGQFQPMARYQHAVRSIGGDPARTVDVGLNYILEGHNARAGLVVQNVAPAVGSSQTTFQLGMQIQQ